MENHIQISVRTLNYVSIDYKAVSHLLKKPFWWQ